MVNNLIQLTFITDFFSFLSDLENDDYFRVLSLAGTAILAIWSVYWTVTKYNRDEKEKIEEREFQLKKMKEQQDHEIKKQKETEREEFLILLGKLQNRWDKLTNQQSRERYEIKKIMDQYTTKAWGANIVQFIFTKNGGDHIVSTKNYTTTVLLESVNYSKDIKGERNDWQDVSVGSQQHEVYFEALVNGYKYIEDYPNNMSSGEFKDIIKKAKGTHIAYFYIGRIYMRHFYLGFQFGEYDAKSKQDLLLIRNQCNKIYAMMKASNLYKEQTELLQEVIMKKKSTLINKGLIDEKFISDYEGYMSKEIDNLRDV